MERGPGNWPLHPISFGGFMANIIIKGKTKFGYTRSEQETNLRREGMRSLSDEQLDKARFLEKKLKEQTGAKDSNIGQHVIGGDSGIKTGE
jgi:hypothetical protein